MKYKFYKSPLFAVAIVLTIILGYAGFKYFNLNKAMTNSFLSKKSSSTSNISYQVSNAKVPDTVNKQILVLDKAENLAERLAVDFGLVPYLRTPIIYDNYNPITKESHYCETSAAADDIKYRSKNPQGQVYALTEYAPSGFFIVVNSKVAQSDVLSTEAVIHEMAHIYCKANNLDQGTDDHSSYYPIIYKRVWDYAYYQLADIL